MIIVSRAQNVLFKILHFWTENRKIKFFFVSASQADKNEVAALSLSQESNQRLYSNFPNVGVSSVENSA